MRRGLGPAAQGVPGGRSGLRAGAAGVGLGEGGRRRVPLLVVAVDGVLERRVERHVVHVLGGRLEVHREGVVVLADDGVVEDDVVGQDVEAHGGQLIVKAVQFVVDVGLVAGDEAGGRGVAVAYLE